MSADLLPMLRQAERELEDRLCDKRYAVIMHGQASDDLPALADKMSQIKKTIGALTVGQMRTV